MLFCVKDSKNKGDEDGQKTERLLAGVKMVVGGCDICSAQGRALLEGVALVG